MTTSPRWVSVRRMSSLRNLIERATFPRCYATVIEGGPVGGDGESAWVILGRFVDWSFPAIRSVKSASVEQAMVCFGATAN